MKLGNEDFALMFPELAQPTASKRRCRCGHTEWNHTKQHPIRSGISVCLVRGYGFLGLGRCLCAGFRSIPTTTKENER